jgi:hypothetical protein
VLEVVAFGYLPLTLHVVSMGRIRSILECLPKLVAMFNGVVALLMPWTPLLEEFLEATRGLLIAVLCTH